MAMSTSSQPPKSQTATPTLNHLLRMPPPQPVVGPGMSPYAMGAVGHPENPQMADSQQQSVGYQQQFDSGHNPVFHGYKAPAGFVANYPDSATRNEYQGRPEFQRQFQSAVRSPISGYPASINKSSLQPPAFSASGIPPGQRFQNQPHLASSPLQEAHNPQPLANGSISVGQSPKPNDQLSGTHPSVTALRQEGPSRSPSRTSAGGSPSAPARHSPVSPAPVSVYGNAANSQSGTSNSQQFPNNNPNGSTGFNGSIPVHPYGNYLYPGGYPEQSQNPQFQNFGTPQNDQLPPYFGQPPSGGYAPRGGYPPSAFPGNYSQMPFGSARAPAFASPPPSQQFPKSQSGTAGSNGYAGDSQQPIQTTPSKKQKTNGPNEGASLPSTPGTQSPGNVSSAEDQVPASPSWPRTPVSPAVSGQRTPVAMVPPPQFHPPSQPSTVAKSSGSKDAGSIVERLTGPYSNFSPDEYSQRRAFYEALVQFCENRAHPITNQPTVSKQPVDLFKLYHAVKDRGGFEAGTKVKCWRELCTMFNIPQSNSAAGQLKRQYDRFLFEYECWHDRGNCDPEPIRKSLESKKKSKAKAAKNASQQQSQAGATDSAPSAGFPPAGPPFAYTQMEGNGPHPPPGSQWPPHPSMVNGPYPAGTTQYGQMPSQQQQQQPPPQAFPRMPPPPVSVASSQPQTGTAAAPPPHSGGEMVARDPFDDRSGTPQMYTPQTGSNRPVLPPVSQAPYQPRQYVMSPPAPSVSTSQVVPPTSHYQQTSAQQPSVSSAQPSYQLVNADSARAQTPVAVNQQPQRQPISLASYPSSNSLPGYSAQGMPYQGYVQQPIYRTPHPGCYQPVSQPQYSEGNQSATPPYVHPSLSTTPTVSSAPPVSVPFPSTNQYGQPGQWQARYGSPAHSQPHSVLPPSNPAVFSGARGPVMRDKSGYFVPPHQYQPNSVYPGGVRGETKTVAPPQMVRREGTTVFPPGSVEATQPTFRKRRKKLSRDIGKVDAWRLMMALKSGLMSESHWALNVLNILLYDDTSAMYFGLRSLPGLLEVLVEHLRRSLMEIYPEENFHVLEEYCSPSTAWSENRLDSELSQHTKLIQDKCGINCVLKEENPFNSRIFCATKNFSRVTRTGRPVLVRNVKPSETQKLGCESEEEGSERNCVMNRSHWKEGGGLDTEHLKLKRLESVEESQCLQFAKKRRREELRISERKQNEEGSDSGAPSVLLFYRRQLKEDEDAVGSDVKTDRASALTENSDYRKSLVGKCLAVSNILRGLVMIPGNEVEMAKHAGLVLILGRLLLIRHMHLKADCKFKRFGEEDRDRRTCQNLWDSGSWVGECATTLREDAFVLVCQLSAQLDLLSHEETVCGPLLTALIHWVVCSSAEAQDPLPPGVLSPLRYSLEALCKLSVLEKNVDLILATPPWPRIEKLLEVLGGLLNLGEEIPCREFALVLVNAICAGSQVACAATALNTPAVHYLVSFLEQADTNMHQVVQAHGMQALRENPELMGTSVGMLRRAGTVLQCLSRVPACRSRFIRHQQRLLQFTMSQLMDSRVAAIIADTLFELQKPSGDLFPTEEEEQEEEEEKEGTPPKTD